MNISVNGQSQIPPGFRFHPTEEELLHYYLRKKVASEKIDLDVIGDVDLNKLEPWDIQEKCRIGSAPQSDWYFFSHKDRKYPTGSRTNRATAAGFWKATGRDKVIYSSFKRIGMRKTLVFYKGRAPHGQKSDWIMHEYRLDDSHDASNANIVAGDCIQEEGWVICRVFKKKNYHHHHQKTLESPQSSFPPQNPTSMDPQKLDQILEYMGRSCKQENNEIPNMADRFMHLPRLESAYSPCFDQESSMEKLFMETDPAFSAKQGMSSTTDAGHRNDWVSYDRLVASQLNGEGEHVSNVHDDQDLMCFPVNYDDVQLSNKQVEIYGGDDHMDLWTTLTRSSSSLSCDPLCHLSV